MRTMVLFLVILLLHVGGLAAQTSILDREVSLEKGDASLGSILLQIGEKGSFLFTYGLDIPDQQVVMELKPLVNPTYGLQFTYGRMNLGVSYRREIFMSVAG